MHQWIIWEPACFQTTKDHLSAGDREWEEAMKHSEWQLTIKKIAQYKALIWFEYDNTVYEVKAILKCLWKWTK